MKTIFTVLVWTLLGISQAQTSSNLDGYNIGFTFDNPEILDDGDIPESESTFVPSAVNLLSLPIWVDHSVYLNSPEVASIKLEALNPEITQISLETGGDWNVYAEDFEPKLEQDFVLEELADLSDAHGAKPLLLFKCLDDGIGYFKMEISFKQVKSKITLSFEKECQFTRNPSLEVVLKELNRAEEIVVSGGEPADRFVVEGDDDPYTILIEDSARMNFQFWIEGDLEISEFDLNEYVSGIAIISSEEKITAKPLGVFFKDFFLGDFRHDFILEIVCPSQDESDSLEARITVTLNFSAAVDVEFSFAAICEPEEDWTMVSIGSSQGLADVVDKGEVQPQYSLDGENSVKLISSDVSSSSFSLMNESFRNTLSFSLPIVSSKPGVLKANLSFDDEFQSGNFIEIPARKATKFELSYICLTKGTRDVFVTLSMGLEDIEFSLRKECKEVISKVQIVDPLLDQESSNMPQSIYFLLMIIVIFLASRILLGKADQDEKTHATELANTQRTDDDESLTSGVVHH